MPVLKSWKCYKLIWNIIEALQNGEIEYTSRLENLLDQGYKIVEVSNTATPTEDNEWICDCGSLVFNADFFHEPIEYYSKYLITWCPVCECQRYMNFVDGLSYYCDVCDSVIVSENESW